MNDHIEKTIADAKHEIQEYEKRIIDLKKFVNQCCAFAKAPPIYSDADLQAAPAVVNSLKGDEYHGLVQSTACRKVLERRKALNSGPATLDELYQELLAGGLEFEARDAAIAKRSLYNMLTKYTSIFRKLPNAKFGLAAWYAGGGKKIIKINKTSPADERGPVEGSDQGVEATDQVSEAESDELSDETAPDAPVQGTPTVVKPPPPRPTFKGFRKL